MTHVSRRSLLAAGSLLLVRFASAPAAAGVAAAGAGRPPLTPDQLDSFIALQPDGTVVALYGKMDPGQGVDVAIAQIVAEELDLPVGSVRVIQGDTARTVNQGGASGSTGVEKAGRTLRYAAAEARRLLVERAGVRLGRPAAALGTDGGFVHVADEPATRVAYRDLLDDGAFHAGLQWNGKIGNDLFSRGAAEPKPPASYRVVGRTTPRTDIAANAFGQLRYVTDIRLPGMLHARVVRPPSVGAEPSAVDEGSVAAIPGVRVVHERGLVAVLAEKEWNAIRAAQALRVTWSDPGEALPDPEQLYDILRTAPATARRDEQVAGDLAAAFAAASRTVEATYEWPFQSHASMVGACAVVDARADGATVWTGTQKPHFAQLGVARLLGLTAESVHVIWTRGPGSYGRNDAGDASLEAAWLSRATGRPVRVQYMRDTGIAWDPKGPASVHRCRAALDAAGGVTGYHFESRGFSRTDVDTNESDPRDTLVGQLLGLGQHHQPAFGAPTEAYTFPAKRIAWETVAPLVRNASPLRTAHLRDPVGPQVNFASESFIDELAAAVGADPLAFRLDHLADKRARAVLEAAAARFGWRARPAAAALGTDDVVRGRGLALAQRSETICAAMVEVEVDRRTGAVRPLRWGVGHDCGLVINPGNLLLTIEGNVVQGTSRALLEEVAFDRHGVTSVDWVSYPILDTALMPDRIDIALVDRPDLPAAGAGEAAIRPVAAAIGNAIYDATGIRLRRAPFTPARVKAALA